MGDEKFRSCWPSHLQQFTSHSANCNSLPSDVRSTSEGPRVWLIDSASEDYLWRALQIHSSSSSSLYRIICVSRHSRLRTGGSCWSKVLLPTCPCWSTARLLMKGTKLHLWQHSYATTTPPLLLFDSHLYPGQRPRWGWEVSQLLAQSSGTVYQPLCELQLSPLWRSLDIWRPCTCLADWQCVSGLFMTRSTNPLIIITW